MGVAARIKHTKYTRKKKEKRGKRDGKKDLHITYITDIFRVLQAIFGGASA